MTTFFITCLLTMPWVFLPIKGITNQFRLPQGMFLNFTFLGLIVFYFLNGAKNVYKNKYLALLIGYVFLNIFFYFFIPFGLEKDVGNDHFVRQINFWALEPMLHFILAVMATYIALSSFDKYDFARIAKAICYSATFIAIWAILQYLGFDPYGKIAIYKCGNKVSACLDNPNLVGNYLALSVPFFFIFFKDRRFIPMFCLVLVGLFVAKSHFAQGLALMGILLYFLLKFRNWIVLSITGLISILSTIFIIKFDYLKLFNELSGRLTCWKFVLQRLKDNILFGQGLGIFKTWEFKTWGDGSLVNRASKWSEIQPLDKSYTIWFNAHNDWLQYAIEIGIIGIFLLTLVIVHSLKNHDYNDEIGLSYVVSFLVFLVMMVASFPLEVPSLAILGLVAYWGTERL